MKFPKLNANGCGNKAALAVNLALRLCNNQRFLAKILWSYVCALGRHSNVRSGEKTQHVGDKDLSGRDKKIIREILQYLVEHPDAKDTSEGIHKWWLPDGDTLGRGEVQEALDLLISKGWLTKRDTVPSKEIYGIDRDRLQEIRSFVLHSGATF